MELRQKAKEVIKDAATWPNAVTAAGLVMTFVGIKNIDKQWGVCLTAGGLLMDKADGWLADLLNQHSLVGKIGDTVVDKIIKEEYVRRGWKLGFAPKPALATMAVHNSVNVAASIAAAVTHPVSELSTEETGRAMQVAYGVGSVFYAEANILKDSHPQASQACRYVGHIATVVGAAVGAPATWEYLQRPFMQEQLPGQAAELAA
jgi:hypothetical protein